MIEGNLEVKLPTYGQTQQHWWEQRIRRERVRRKKNIKVRKGRNIAKSCVFYNGFCGSRGWRGKLAKAATSGGMRDPKLRAAVARSRFGNGNGWKWSKHLSFGALVELRCRKSGRRAGTKQISKSKPKSRPCSEHFWKHRCWKSSLSCGAKHMSKSKR